MAFPFTINELTHRTWVIEENSSAFQGFQYLLEGDNQALLIDTGMGTGDLLSEVDNLTDKPVTVVCTHGHFDHIAYNYKFGEIYIHEAETELLEKHLSPEYLIRMCKHMVPGEELRKNMEPYLQIKSGGNYHYIKNGHTFDLGDRKLEAFHIPGHSEGSICLFERETRLLFNGDSMSEWGILMHLDHSVSIDVFYGSLLRFEKLSETFDLLYPGHHRTPIKNEFVNDFIYCAKRIMDKTLPLRIIEDGGPYLEASYGRICITLPLNAEY